MFAEMAMGWLDEQVGGSERPFYSPVSLLKWVWGLGWLFHSVFFKDVGHFLVLVFDLKSHVDIIFLFVHYAKMMYLL